MVQPPNPTPFGTFPTIVSILTSLNTGEEPASMAFIRIDLTRR